MAGYIEFDASDDGRILVEVEAGAIAPEGGVVKAGLRQTARDIVERVPAQFEAALEAVLRLNVRALMQAVRGMPDPPDEVQLTFGLKATGEVGYFAVGKTGGEVNYTVTLTWRSAKDGTAEHAD